MTSCRDMKLGDLYVCEGCGIELQVVKECKDHGTAVDDCACHDDNDPCSFSCCGASLIKKS